MSEKIIIVAEIISKPGEIENLKAEVLKLIEPSRAEPGNISYELHRDLEDDNKLVMIEQFKDEEAFQKHAASEHFQSFGESAKPYLAGVNIKKLNRLA
ncbi:putative quinol monooxygenase [Pseudovibrio sp. SPO723]|uniref:putative quinol monooxygenase n=1 Tax=Nesiotobacter zosterae TaxID=392721 RepID=UPI0029C1E736|nr:putative quinol monooxygenase [Pseudovibrio sp. SPO723]MDX5593477.1 putative quinol monooxygenase [Pseudovibrio sp. SPO723]